MSQPMLDPAALDRLRRIGGDRLVNAMMTSFLDHAGGRIADARNALAMNDAQAVSDAAHAIKSSAGNIGATSLQMVAQKVEREAVDEEAALGALVDELGAAFEEARVAAIRARDASSAG